MRYHIPRDFYLFIFMYNRIFNRKQNSATKRAREREQASEARNRYDGSNKQMKITTATTYSIGEAHNLNDIGKSFARKKTRNFCIQFHESSGNCWQCDSFIFSLLLFSFLNWNISSERCIAYDSVGFLIQRSHWFWTRRSPPTIHIQFCLFEN